MAKMYANIPFEIISDSNLTPNSKILYGVIKGLTYKDGYCYASNKYLGKILEVDTRTITRLVSNLINNNFIRAKYYDQTKRSIYIVK